MSNGEENPELEQSNATTQQSSPPPTPSHINDNDVQQPLLLVSEPSGHNDDDDQPVLNVYDAEQKDTTVDSHRANENSSAMLLMADGRSRSASRRRASIFRPPEVEEEPEAGAVDLAELDISTLVKDETFDLEKPMIDTDFLTAVIGLVLSIATMMSAAQQFADGVNGKLIKDYGEEKFELVIQVLTFFPMIYSPLLILIYNTKLSKDVFHEYLAHGILVDFPDSASVDYLVSHPTPILFIIVTMAYVGFSASIFVKFLAPSSIWLIFYKQLLFEIILSWKAMQTIEDDVITISEFVEAFDDRGEDEKLVDRYSTQRAAQMVLNLRPARSRPSYKAYTEKYGINRRSQKKRMLIRFLIVLAICVICVVTYFWFSFEALGEAQDAWKKQLNPCAQVCYDKTGRLKEMCFNCVCDCATALGIKFDVNSCLNFFAVPGCLVRDACLLGGNRTCNGV